MGRVSLARSLLRRFSAVCLVALAAAGVCGNWRRTTAAGAASLTLLHEEPVTMTFCEFCEAAIRFDLHCIEARERLLAASGVGRKATPWRSEVGFSASPPAFQSWAQVEGPFGVRGCLEFSSGGLDSEQVAGASVWKGAAELPLSGILRLVRPDAHADSHVEGEVRAAECRVALVEGRAVAAALGLLRAAERAAASGDDVGAAMAYGELALLIGVSVDEVKPITIAGDGLAQLHELIARALEADPGLLLREWLARDPDLVAAQTRLAASMQADCLLDAVTLSVGFRWSHLEPGPRLRAGVALDMGACALGVSSQPETTGEADLCQRRVDALKARSIAQFTRILDQLQSAAQADAWGEFESAGIVLLARLGVFPLKP